MAFGVSALGSAKPVEHWQQAASATRRAFGMPAEDMGMEHPPEHVKKIVETPRALFVGLLANPLAPKRFNIRKCLESVRY